MNAMTKRETPRMPLLPEARIWWLVKTTMTPEGELNAEIFKDQFTNQIIVIQSDQKPLDASFGERSGNTIYYTYHETYDEAAQQIEMTGSHAEPYY